MPTDEEKKRKAIKRLQKYSTQGKMPRAGLYELATRRRKIAKLEAQRKAAAKIRAARGTTTQAELEARKRATKPTPTKPTQSQQAAGLRERLMPDIPGRKRLIEALTPKKEED